MNGRMRLPQPINVAQKLAFSKHSPIRRGELYLSYAVLLGGKVSLRFVAQQVQYVSCWGVAMAPLLRLEHRQARPVACRVIRGARRSLLLGHGQGNLPFLATGPRPWALWHRPCQVRLLPNCEPPL
jgi:hypothetical protein